jgi:hypothetical protein
MTGNWELIRRAATVLIGSGAMKQRLIEAYREHLLAVDAGSLPEPVGRDFVQLMNAFRGASAAGGLGVAEVAVRKMSEQDAARHAQNVLEILVALSAHEPATLEPTSAPPRLRVVGDDEEVPAFLSRA